MKILKKNFCTGDALLLFALIISIGFGYWIGHKSEEEKAREFYIQLSWLILNGNEERARIIGRDKLAEGGDSALDYVWLKLVQSQDNGYDQLLGYIRLLKADPDQETIYMEIAELIKHTPQSFHHQSRYNYLSLLNAISGIRMDYLESFGLLQEGEE